MQDFTEEVDVYATGTNMFFLFFFLFLNQFQLQSMDVGIARKHTSTGASKHRDRKLPSKSAELCVYPFNTNSLKLGKVTQKLIPFYKVKE